MTGTAPAPLEIALLTELRTGARLRVARAELPVRSLEAWRKVDLAGLDARAFATLAGAAADGTAGAKTTTIVPRTNTERLSLSAAATRPDTAAFVTEALRFYANDGYETFFTALNTATGDETVLVLAGQSAEPLRLVHTPRAALACPRTLLFVAPGAELTLIEEFQTEGAHDATGTRLFVPMTDVFCSPGSRLNYVRVARFGPDDFHFHHFRAVLMRDSTLNLFLFPIGGRTGKSFYQVETREPGAECRAVGCAVGQGHEYNDMDLRMEHRASHTNSSILFRSVVRDRAHHVFYGNLYIEPGLKNVSSRQSNNNVILGPRARAESMPNLIVRAEDVRAEHGATAGELDQEALFFLMARGLPEDQARALLLQGFIDTVLRELPGDSLRDEIKARLDARLV